MSEGIRNTQDRPARKPTADDMRRALYRHFQQRWVLLPEVTARAATYGEKDRRIDMLMLLRDEAARTAHLATQPEHERFYWREDDWRHKVAPPSPDLAEDPRQEAS